MNSPSLNRRHKVGLLFVVAGAGISLICDATAKQTVGFVLIGLACVWLLASLSLRTGGLFLSAAGVSSLLAPVLTEWNSFRGRGAAYDAAVADLHQAAAKATLGKLAEDSKEVTFSSLPTGFFQ